MITASSTLATTCDGSARPNRPLLDRIRFPRQLVFPVVLVVVMGTLLALNW